jgi:hypothetical protein
MSPAAELETMVTDAGLTVVDVEGEGKGLAGRSSHSS